MNRIRELREEKKITQIRLSIELEVSQETISAYEMEKYYPSVKSLIKLQNIFGVSIDYILGLSDTRYERIETNSLAQDETRLINLYRKLDSLGKERITSYLEGYINALLLPYATCYQYISIHFSASSLDKENSSIIFLVVSSLLNLIFLQVLIVPLIIPFCSAFFSNSSNALHILT